MCLMAQLVSLSGDSYISYLSAPLSLELPSLPSGHLVPGHPPASHYLGLSSLSPYHFLNPIIGLFCHDSCPRVVCFFLSPFPSCTVVRVVFPSQLLCRENEYSTIVSESRQTALKSQESTPRSISGNSDKDLSSNKQYPGMCGKSGEEGEKFVSRTGQGMRLRAG